MPDDLFVRCPACGSRKMAVELIDKTLMVKGRQRTVRDISAHVCGACGQRFLDARAAASLERTLGLGRPRRRRIRAA